MSHAHRPLAQVELQLIMRMCDLHSLLALARCSRSTLRAASSDFAWSALSPIEFRSTIPQLAERVAGSLLRFADIGVRWVHARVRHLQSEAKLEEVDALVAVPRLRSLDTRGRRYCTVLTERLLESSPPTAPRALFVPSPDSPFRHLTALMTDSRTLRCEWLHRLEFACPILRRLHVLLDPGYQRQSAVGPYFHQMVLLKARMAPLTDIGIEAPEASAIQTQPLAQLVGLDAFTCAKLHGSKWQPLLTAPNMRSIRQLTLRHVSAAHARGVDQDPSPIDWAACFANLSLLHSLTLEQCGPIDVMLSALSVASDSPLVSLHIIILEDGLAPLAALSPYSRARATGSPAPTRAALVRLLTPCPDRRLVIQCESEEVHVAARALMKPGNAAHAAAVAAEWKTAVQNYTALARRMLGRVRLVCGVSR